MATKLTQFRSPQTVVARFVARRTLRSAALWAFIFGVYTASKTVGFASAYPTVAERGKFTASLSNNTGLTALLGQPHQVATMAGFANWNTLGVVTIIASIWSLMLATKYLRGEEDSGRSELLLTGQTTQRQATINTMLGMGSSLVVMYVIVSVAFIGIGHIKLVGWDAQNALFFALASVSGAAIFMSAGALMSQLAPTRGRAAGWAATVFGICFLLRATGDITSAHWLLNITPLGWIEKTQPLVGSQPVWLLPILITTFLICAVTIWLSGWRDMGASLVGESDVSKPHTRLLNTPLMAGVRLARASTIAWLIGTALLGIFYGVLTKSAAQALASASNGIQSKFNQLESTSKLVGSKLFLGIVFFILMAVIMGYVSSAISKVREDEANGYADNFLVGPVSRTRWLGGRLVLILVFGFLACLTGALGAWAGQLTQHNGVSLGTFLLSGLNMIAPAVFTLGAAVLTLGWRPRLTGLVAYSVLGWSFMIFMVSSGINLSHWILDTSVLHQMSLAPATDPNWKTNSVMMFIGLVLGLIGFLRFTQRDLQSE